ncbi:AMP-binding protein [Streptomyces sp. FL07-04A]|uniref:AMP-binding protein n=1 Tax=Streptomyces sp. FL07-04A TaxID=3028658 RepID=UPI0029AF6B76|nr:AMP-binding protein [Streptomyces sp. FL07-04A]MDX3578123.1 AMP-binding protein [Streptomyces sp. FL07-04A]
MALPVTETVQPATQQQQSVWAAQQLHPSSDAYNIPIAYRIRGAVDAGALDSAIRQLLHRHPVLRTSLVEQPEGVLRQLVHDVPECVLDVHDVLDEQEERLISAAAATPFTAENDLRLRAHLFRSAPDDLVLLLVLDHVVADAPSVALAVSDLSDFYRAAVAGEAEAVDVTPRNGYFEYAVSQGEFVESAEGREHAEFWKQHVQGIGTFPGDWSDFNFSEQPLRASSVPVELPPELLEKCDSLGFTPFSALLSAFSLTLQQFHRCDDILIGYPAVDWRRSMYREVVGLFSELLPFRPPHRQTPTLPDYVVQVQESVLDMLAHQGSSMKLMWEELRGDRGPSPATGLSAVMSFNDIEKDAGLCLPGVVAERIPLLPRDGKTDLLLSVNVRGSAIRGRLDFREGACSPSAARGLACAFGQVLEQILSGQDIAAQAVRLVPEAALEPTGNRFPENTSAPLPNVPAAFTACAAATPEAVAVIADGLEITYRELEESSRHLAARLASLGLPPGSAVALCLPPSAALVKAALAVLRCGFACLYVDMGRPARRRAFVLNDARVAAVVTDTVQHVFPGDRPVVDVDPDSPSAGSGFAEAPVEESGTAFLVTVDGSGRLPRTVAVSHRAISHHLAWKQRRFGIGTQDRFLFSTPPASQTPLWECLAPLALGAAVVIVPPTTGLEPAGLLEELRRHEVTVAQIAPTLLKAVLAAGGLDGCGALRWLFVRGEPLDQPVVDAVGRTSSARVVHLYGAPETTGDAIFHVCAPDHQHSSVVPIGRPVDGALACVVGAGGQVLPPGFVGELLLGGVPVAAGYVNRDRLTAERFTAGPPATPWPHSPKQRFFRSGDLARMREDGLLELLGYEANIADARASRGVRDVVRRCLLEHPDVGDAVVQAHPEHRDVVVAHFVAPSEVTADEIRAYLADRLPAECLPDHLVRLDSLPLTSTGTADTRALPLPVPGGRGAAEGRQRGVLEQRIAQLWAEALGLPEERVPRSVSFFKLGGTSMAAVRLHRRMREQICADMPLTDLFKHQTVSALADALSGRHHTSWEQV